MLDSIRKRKDNLVFTLLIVVVILVMGFFGLGQFGDNNQGQNSGPIAYVNGEAISAQEFRQQLASQMQQYEAMLGGQYNEQLLSALRIPERTLDQMVQMKLMAQQANQLGCLVPDNELAYYIRSLPYFQKDGKFDAEGYSKLPDRGRQEGLIREQLVLTKFQGYLAGRIKPTTKSAETTHLVKNTKIDLFLAKIDPKTLGSGQKASATAIDEALKNTPETALKAAYEQRIKEFTTPGSVDLAQIRVGIPFKATDEQRALAKRKIEEIAKAVTPANFAEVAKSKSDDVYAKKGGALGKVARGTLEEPIERALDTLEVGKVSAPVETSFGYFLLLAKDKKLETVQPFETAKRAVAEKIAQEKVQADYAERTRKGWEESLAQGKSIEAELAKLKIQVKKTGPFAADSNFIPTVGQADAILDGVFELSQSQPMAKKLFFHQDNYYYVKLASVERAKPLATDKERETAEDEAARPLRNELVQGWVKQLEKTATVKKEVDLSGGKQADPNAEG